MNHHEHTPTTYELCSVPTYKVNYDKSRKICKPINEITKILQENDLQFHERLHKDDKLKLFVDVDKLRLHNPTLTLENIFKYLFKQLI
jgi:hypothetical protein